MKKILLNYGGELETIWIISMNKNEILKKIEQIERLFEEIKSELSDREEEKIPNKKIKTLDKDLFNDDDLINDYENLYKEFLTKGYEGIENFISEKNKNYLKAFSRVNNLSIDISKISKKKLTEEIVAWMRQRKEISK